MFEHAREYGLIYQSKPPYEVMKTNWLSFDEVLKIKQVEELVGITKKNIRFYESQGLLDVERAENGLAILSIKKARIIFKRFVSLMLFL